MDGRFHAECIHKLLQTLLGRDSAASIRKQFNEKFVNSGVGNYERVIETVVSTRCCIWGGQFGVC